MNLIPLEWSEAQDVLLKLVQALTPWTGKEVSSTFFLSRRFAFPSNDREEISHIRSSIKLLTMLRSTREFVNDWVDEEEKAPEAQKRGDKKDGPIPFARQAQRMIDEVQEAIGSMVYSANLKDPKEEPLRAALKRLKPHLDELIEAVSHEGMEPADHRSALFRFALPASRREHLFRPLAQRGEKPGREVGERRGSEIEKTTLPAAPFISPVKNPIASEKKKKKRKGFWFREDDEKTDQSL